MFYTLNLLITAEDTVVDKDGIGVGTEVSEHVLHLDMAAEAYYLVTDGVLESKDHADGDNHNSQADGDTDCGNMDSWTAHLTLVALITVNPLCYEKREVHSSSTLPG